METQPLILANDIAGLGKVASTAALPLLAACQLEVALLPTVLLSSHTGGYPQVYIDPYEEGMAAFLSQWRSLDQDFSVILTGYLRTAGQIDQLLDFAAEKKLPLLVDPIMGDRGQLYQGFDQAFVREMGKLVSQADLVLPNLTEACLLLGRDYEGDLLPESRLREICQGLADLGARRVLLTGILAEPDRIGLAYYQADRQDFQTFYSRRWDQHFFGTGDMVAALAAAGLVRGLPLEQVLPLILDFLDRSLAATLARGADLRLGVFYQPYLADLARDFQKLIENRGKYNEKESS